jgi:Uma2 family endonuclease
VRFELIGGVVHIPSPQRRRHSRYQSKLDFVLGLYEVATPGLELLINPTTILSESSEPEPDLQLRVLSAFGGQSRETEDDYVEGPPELMAEISYATRRIDLGQKRIDYQEAGVIEYLVLDVERQELHWFHFPSGRPITPNRQGIWKSRVFPGLWLDGRALLARDSARLVEVVQKGLASREHAAFVKRLQADQRQRSQQ